MLQIISGTYIQEEKVFLGISLLVAYLFKFPYALVTFLEADMKNIKKYVLFCFKQQYFFKQTDKQKTKKQKVLLVFLPLATVIPFFFPETK